MKVFTLFQQNKKKLLRNAGTFFLDAAVLSRKILVKAEYQIGTQYQQIINIKRTQIGIGVKKKKKP